MTAVAAAETHSLALTSDGKVTAWGTATGPGQTNSVLPSLENKTVTAIAAADTHSLALTSDGKVTGWGAVGLPSTPPDSLNGKTVTAIAAGPYYSLALTSDGKVTSWGTQAEPGRSNAVPASLADKTVTAIAVGYGHALALTSDGKVTGWTWTESDFGQATIPHELAGKTVTAVAAGNGHSLALTSDGKVTAWGWNGSGQAEVPDELADKTVTAIATSNQHNLALTTDGKVYAWGSSYDGESTVPDELGGKVVTALAAGGVHSLAVTTDFRAEGNPTISGPPVIGGRLTATPGRHNSSPDKVTYQWYADGAPIIGATNATYHPAGAQLGKHLIVEVRAFRGDGDPVVTTSDPTAPITRGVSDPGQTVPGVKLEASKPTVRRGQAVTLLWSSTGATSVVASGGWSGTRAAAGGVHVKPTQLGTTTYVLTAANATGTTTAQVQVKVTRPPAKFKVTTAKGPHRAGTKVKITVRGLEAGERYTIRVGKKKVAGTTKNARPLVRAIPLPQAGGRATIRVTGDQTDRTGTTTIRVTRG